MSDYSELKRLAKAAMYAYWHKDDLGDALEVAPLDDEVQAFILSASTAVMFELIAKNDRIESEAVYSAAGFSAAREEIARLKAENESLFGSLVGVRVQISVATTVRKQAEAERDAALAEIAQCRSDSADLWGLTQGRADTIDQLKAENEALRKRIDDMSPLKGAPLTGHDLKCLACGGYHYGMSGLPCPKMAPMAGASMSQGEQA